MASIKSDITADTTNAGAEYSEDSYSIASLDTRENDELYDHRQHQSSHQSRHRYNLAVDSRSGSSRIRRPSNGHSHRWVKSPTTDTTNTTTAVGTALEDVESEALLESDRELLDQSPVQYIDDKVTRNLVSEDAHVRNSPINFASPRSSMAGAPPTGFKNRQAVGTSDMYLSVNRPPMPTRTRSTGAVNINSSSSANHRQRSDSFVQRTEGSPLNKIVSKVSSVLPRKSSDGGAADNYGDGPTAGGSATNHRRSFDSNASHTSAESQETEEDVCFPMQPPLHTRINGVDFDELEEFAQQQRERNLHYMSQAAAHSTAAVAGMSTGTSTALSSAALRYTPKNSTGKKQLPQMPPPAVHVDSASSSSSGVSSSSYSPPGKVILENKHDTESIAVRTKSLYVGDEFEMQSLGASVSFNSGNNKIEGEENNTVTVGNISNYPNQTFTAPDRFYFFSSQTEETIHAPDIPSLVNEGQTFYNLFNGGEAAWWLDCSCPTDDEMRCIAKAFGIHPLTAEDIRMQETREKVELFKSYYFVCFHTFDSDRESENFLEPINVYIVIFRQGILTFHFNPISHCANVRRRVRQLRDYVEVTSDWLCYALIDDITDSFAPVIQSIEYEADWIEDSVFVYRDLDFAKMITRIGESRRKAMTLMRLLSGKADVIKMFSKRCQDEANGIGPALTSQINIANLQQDTANGNRYYASHSFYAPHNRGSVGPVGQSPMPGQTPQSGTPKHSDFVNQPRGEIAMYLGDIQDHLLTMHQNLAAYEKIFSRSHSNYLAQLQVESYYTDTKVTEMLGKVTVLGAMLLPINVVPGLFGMNVHIPGENADSLAWFFGIVGCLMAFAVFAWFGASYWINTFKMPMPDPNKDRDKDGKIVTADGGTKSMISSVWGKAMGHHRARGYARNDSNVQRSDHSTVSFPSKYSRWN